MIQQQACGQSACRNRAPSPERWQKAAQRAVDEAITVRQCNDSGMWVANSGSNAALAYTLNIRHGIVLSCSCPAGEFGDPCCKHAARYYLDAGTLILDPAPAVDCPDCHGCGVHYDKGLERAGLLYPASRSCGGTGVAPSVAVAA